MEKNISVTKMFVKLKTNKLFTIRILIVFLFAIFCDFCDGKHCQNIAKTLPNPKIPKKSNGNLS
jgi:hypothetical protein